MSSYEYSARPSLPWEDLVITKQPEEILSAPDLMLKGIHIKLIHFFSFCKELSTSLGSKSRSLCDLFLLIDRESNGEFQYILKCYQKISKYYCSALLDSIIQWYNQEISQQKNDEKYRVITNYLFAKLIIQILLANLHNSFDNSIINPIINILFNEYCYSSSINDNNDSKGKHRTTQKKIDIKENDLNSQLRIELLDLFTQTIGLLSRSSFIPIVESFYDHMNKLDTNSPIRILLTYSMRNISLPLKTEDDVTNSKALVRYFVSQIDKKPKIEVLHAYIQSLGEFLMKVCEMNDNKDWHQSWREFITDIYYSLKKPCKRLKDQMPAIILEIGTMCSGKKYLLGQQPIVILDRLIKLLKIPEKRCAALDCIFFIVTTLFLNYDNTEFDISKDLILEKIRLEIFHSFKKSGCKECIPVMVDLVYLISIIDIKYSFSNFILPMISPHVTLELQLVGINTFKLIADNTHVTFDKTYAFTKRQPSISLNNYRRHIHTSFRLEESGTSSLNLSDDMLNTFRIEFGKIFLIVNNIIGNSLGTTSGKLNYETNLKLYDKILYMDILHSSISCISRIPPSSISTLELIHFIVNKAFYPDPSIAEESKVLLIALVRTRPSLRICILEELGFFILQIPDDNTRVIRKSISFLIDIIMVWYDPMALNTREIDEDYIDFNVSKQKIFNASLFEGISLILLCNECVHVRNTAFNLLFEVYTLNSVLPDNLSNNSTRVLSIIQKYENNIISMHNNNFGSLSRHFTTVEEIILGSEGEQEEWSRCIGSIIPFLQQEQCEALDIAFSLACPKIEYITSILLPFNKKDDRATISISKKELSPISKDSDFDTIILWRNLIILACSIATPAINPFVEQLGYLENMDISWLIDLILPSLFISNERIRNSMQLAIRYCKDSFAFSIPTLVYIYLESIKKKDGSIQNKDIIRAETSKLYSNLTENYYETDIISRPFETRTLSFISETIEYLTQPPQDILWSLQQQRIEFFKICTFLFLSMGNKKSVHRTLTPAESQNLLHFILGFTGHGPLFWEHKDKELKMKEQYFEKIKDREISQAEEHFNSELNITKKWSNRCLQGILQMELTFNDDTFKENSSLFLYSLSVFEFEESITIQEYSRLALISAIKSNPKFQESMLQICINNSYHNNRSIAYNFFKILSITITSNCDINYPLLPTLCLALYKSTNSNLDIRKQAFELLNWLSTRYFRTKTYIQYHCRIAQTKYNINKQIDKFVKEFALLHPDLHLDIILEFANHIAFVSQNGKHRIISLIILILEQVELCNFTSKIREQLIKLLILISTNLKLREDLIKKLWTNIALKQGNIIHLITILFNIILYYQNEDLTNITQSFIVYIIKQDPKIIFDYLSKDLHSTSTRPFHNILSDDNDPIINNEPWKFDSVFTKYSFIPSLTKGDFIIVILSEILHVCDVLYWKDYIADYLVTSILSIDHSHPFIYENAKTLLVNLLYCSCEDKFIHSSDIGNTYKELINIVDKSYSKQIWSNNEDKHTENIINNVLQLCVKILLTIDSNIIEKISKNALIVSSCIDLSNHQICRALAIYRCVGQKEFSSDDIHELIGILLLHIQNRETRQQIGTVNELEKIFEYIIITCSSDKIKHMPKLFWCGVALLRSDISQDYFGGISIIEKYISKVDFYSKDIQDQLQLCFPHSWVPNFPGVSILLLKGFCSKYQEELSRNLLCNLISPVYSNIIDIDNIRSRVVFIIALLPHLLTFLGGINASEIAKKISLSIEPLNKDLSKIFGDYDAYRTSLESLRRFTLEVVNRFSNEFFPKYESFVFTLLIGMLEKGPKKHNKTILQIIEALLHYVDFNSSPLFKNELAVFAPILNFLQGDCWPQALAVMEIILGRSNNSSLISSININDLPRIRTCISDCQKILDYWNQLERGKAVVFSGLAKVMQSDENNITKLQLHPNNINIEDNTEDNVKSPRRSSKKKKRVTKRKRKSKKKDKKNEKDKKDTKPVSTSKSKISDENNSDDNISLPSPKSPPSSSPHLLLIEPTLELEPIPDNKQKISKLGSFLKVPAPVPTINTNKEENKDSLKELVDNIDCNSSQDNIEITNLHKDNTNTEDNNIHKNHIDNKSDSEENIITDTIDSNTNNKEEIIKDNNIDNIEENIDSYKNENNSINDEEIVKDNTIKNNIEENSIHKSESEEKQIPINNEETNIIDNISDNEDLNNNIKINNDKSENDNNNLSNKSDISENEDLDNDKNLSNDNKEDNIPENNDIEYSNILDEIMEENQSE